MASGASAAIAGTQAFSGIAGAFESRGQARLLQKQAELEQMQLRHNAEMVEIQGKELLEKSKDDVFRRQQQVKQMLGAQKVALAAQGITVEGDLGKALEKDERTILKEDSEAIKNNAWREAFGLELKAQDFRNEAVFAGMKARYEGGLVKSKGLTSASRSFASAAQTFATDPYRSRKKK